VAAGTSEKWMTTTDVAWGWDDTGPVWGARVYAPSSRQDHLGLGSVSSDRLLPTDAGRFRIAPIRASIELRSLSKAANSASCASPASIESPIKSEGIAGSAAPELCREALPRQCPTGLQPI